MVHDVQVSGDVVALGTPVSAYILVHPSDGRCPWSHPMSDGYRSDDSGRFERTCSDARLGSKIDVLVVDDAHELWRRPYRVESDESGPKPIEVRAVLTPKPTPAGATPSATPHDELNWTSWSGHVRGVGRTPLPWASVSLQGGTCLSPVHTDDQGRFDIICYGGHGLYTIWRMAVLADGYKPWEKSWRLVDFRQPLNIDLVPLAETATLTPSATVMVTTPTPTATVTPWDGEPSPSYLPIVLQNTARESIPTAAAAPPTATLRPDEYFFLETWSHQERGPGCYMLYVDYPTYSFDEETGVLQVNGLNRLNPRLEQSDIGYLGSGSSLSGRGSGDSSHLATFDSTPFVFEDLELRSFDGSGSVTLKRGAEVIELESGAEWRRTWSGESPGEPGCVVTDTHRISNYGLQDRRRIVYSAASAGARTRHAWASSRTYGIE